MRLEIGGENKVVRRGTEFMPREVRRSLGFNWNKKKWFDFTDFYHSGTDFYSVLLIFIVSDEEKTEGKT